MCEYMRNLLLSYIIRSNEFVDWLQTNNLPSLSTAIPYRSFHAKVASRLAEVKVTTCLPARSNTCVRASEFTKTFPVPSTHIPVAARDTKCQKNSRNKKRLTMLTVVEQPVSATFGPKAQQVRVFLVHQHNPNIGGNNDQMKLGN